MTTKEQFLQMIETHPLDWELKGVFADWLEEQGENDLAGTFRWCVQNRQHPLPTPSKSYFWLDLHGDRVLSEDIHCLLTCQPEDGIDHDFLAAFLRLSRALKELDLL